MTIGIFFLYEGFYIAIDTGKYMMINYIFVLHSYICDFFLYGKTIGIIDAIGSLLTFISLYKIFIKNKS